MSKKQMKIVLPRLMPNRKSLKLTRLNLMPPTRLMQSMLLTEPPLKLQQPKKSMKNLNSKESSTHSMVLFMKTMALAGTMATVWKFAESTSF